MCKLSKMYRLDYQEVTDVQSHAMAAEYADIPEGPAVAITEPVLYAHAEFYTNHNQVVVPLHCRTNAGLILHRSEKVRGTSPQIAILTFTDSSRWDGQCVFRGDTLVHADEAVSGYHRWEGRQCRVWRNSGIRGRPAGGNALGLTFAFRPGALSLKNKLLPSSTNNNKVLFF